MFPSVTTNIASLLTQIFQFRNFKVDEYDHETFMIISYTGLSVGPKKARRRYMHTLDLLIKWHTGGKSEYFMLEYSFFNPTQTGVYQNRIIFDKVMAV